MSTEQNAPFEGDEDALCPNSGLIISFGSPGPIRGDLIDIDTDNFLDATKDLTPKQSGAFMLLAIHMHRTNDRTFLEDAGQVARVLKCSKIAWLTKLKPAVMPLLDRVGSEEAYQGEQT